MLTTDRIIALDIGASGVKMAEFIALKSGGIELVNFAIGSLGLDMQTETDREAYIVTTIRELMREHAIKPGPALISVSGQSVFSRFVKLPPVAPDKIYQIILYEAQQNVPFPIDEVVWDYQLIGGQEGQIDVMLAAIKAEIIENITDCVQSANLTPDLVDVAPMALFNAVRYNYGDLPGCTLVVDIGARSTDLIFIEEGRIFSRSIPVAGNAITQQIMREFEMSFSDAEDLKKAHAFVSFGGAYEGPPSEVADKVSKSVRTIMTRMHAEINRSVNFYRSQQAGSMPELILLTGGSSVIPYTDTFLKDKLKVEVDYLNPFRNVAVSEDISGEAIGARAHLLGETVGLALRRVLSCPIEINLMPKKVLAEKDFKKKQPLFYIAAAGLILTLLVWCGYFYKMKQLANKREEKVSGQVQRLEKIGRDMQGIIDQGQAIEGKMNTLMTLVDSRSTWLEMLDQVHIALPGGMWLTSIKPVVETVKETVQGREEKQSLISAVEVAGMGYIDEVKSAQPILDFRDALREVSFFNAQETEIQLTPAPAPGDVAREFKILIVLESPLSL
ncbi:MAG: type IV pilus assembly protein PilM [Spartobacteria bacterium]|nr:type IV pilus assembly protein PilM [Spartobacteria bacterium]